MDYDRLFQQIREGAIGAIDQALLENAPPDKVWLAREESIDSAVYHAGGLRDERSTAMADREVEHVASTERACGMFHDVVLQNAWDFAEFEEIGSPLLWGHNREHPIGRVLEMRKGQRRNERAIISHSRFQPESMSPMADQVWSWVAGGWVRGVSVGFKIVDSREPTREDHKRWALKPFSRIVTRASLGELSVTPCPADKGATKLRGLRHELERAAATGEIERETAEAVLPFWGVPELAIERFWPKVDPSQDEVVYRNAKDLPPELERRFDELLDGIDERLSRLTILAERFEEAAEARQGRAPAHRDDSDDVEDELEGFPDPAEFARSVAQGLA